MQGVVGQGMADILRSTPEMSGQNPESSTQDGICKHDPLFLSSTSSSLLAWYRPEEKEEVEEGEERDLHSSDGHGGGGELRPESRQSSTTSNTSTTPVNQDRSKRMSFNLNFSSRFGKSKSQSLPTSPHFQLLQSSPPRSPLPLSCHSTPSSARFNPSPTPSSSSRQSSRQHSSSELSPVHQMLAEGTLRVQEHELRNMDRQQRWVVGTLEPAGLVVAVHYFKPVPWSGASQDATHLLSSLRRLGHPHLAAIFLAERCAADGTLKLCMEYFDTTLADLIYRDAPQHPAALLVAPSSPPTRLTQWVRNQNCESPSTLSRRYSSSSSAALPPRTETPIPFTALEILTVADRLCRALVYLHKEAGLVHGSVCARNCLLRLHASATLLHDPATVIKLGGFEHLGIYNSAQITRCGSARWMAPEVIGRGSILETVVGDAATNPAGAGMTTIKKIAVSSIHGESVHDTNAKCDVWALGMLLFEAATMQEPFHWNDTEPFGLEECISTGAISHYPDHWTPQFLEEYKRILKLHEWCTTFSAHKRPDSSAVLGKIAKYVRRNK
jgi:hypothetical protein